MEAKEYIEKKISNLVTNFPQLKVSYEIDSYSSSNYIKVLPGKSFYNDKDYQKFETEFIMEFIERYPNEEIVFVSDNCLIDVSNPIYLVEGDFYEQKSFAFSTNIWSDNIELDFNLTLKKSMNEIFENYNSLNNIANQLNSSTIQGIEERPVIINQEEESYFAFAA
ncbi:hypothetical protein [Flammeovirga sp. EKP202]|uniref:hypothetical protein n=1 Tax=Flammeovirga sp. EKP202 TaxID=2770592 RepID=UPI00165F9C7C|nr:hypothetical protein [Flammeovirga sp. EKP202]MBD0403201.1 hypothetical protein [Flammeovirga sp. EKP202]